MALHVGDMPLYLVDTVCLALYCEELVELMVLSCRPYYLPRELSCIRLILILECARNDSDGCAVTERISDAVSLCLDNNPDAVVLVIGDLMAVMSAQSCSTSNSMGKSDHHNLLLMPTYEQELKRTAKSVKHIKVWRYGMRQQRTNY